jgi:DNA-binding response OmpR family regulator
VLQFLVAEPDTNVSDVLADGLHATFGAAVTRAVSCEVATQSLHKLSCDLAIIETDLPDMSGFVLAEVAANCNVPALMISAHPQGQQDCHIHGYPHLTKPFTLGALVSAAKIAIRDCQQNIEQLHRAYKSVTATFRRTEIIDQQTRQTMDEARRIISESKRVRLQSSELRIESMSGRQTMRTNRLGRQSSDPSMEVMVVLDNIARFRSLLQCHGADKLDEETERIVARLLAKEKAKLVALDQPRKPPEAD